MNLDRMDKAIRGLMLLKSFFTFKAASFDEKDKDGKVLSTRHEVRSSTHFICNRETAEEADSLSYRLNEKFAFLLDEEEASLKKLLLEELDK